MVRGQEMVKKGLAAQGKAAPLEKKVLIIPVHAITVSV